MDLPPYPHSQLPYQPNSHTTVRYSIVHLAVWEDVPLLVLRGRLPVVEGGECAAGQQ